MQNDKEVFRFNFTDIIEFLWNWKWHLMLICGVAGIAAAVFSGPYFIKPRYKSEVIFYPTTINSIGNALLTELNKRESDMLSFGEEEEAENALQILQSDNLMERVIRNFDLMGHYGIDSNEKFPQTKLKKKIKKNISFERTRYLSIAITVLDEDPVMAAKIANGISEVYDSVKTEVQQELAMELYKIVESEFRTKEKEVWDLRMTLKKLGEKGVLNVDEQSWAIGDALYKAKASGSHPERIKELQNDLDSLGKYGGEYTNTYETLILELDELSEMRKRYKKAKVDIENTVTHKFVLTQGTPAEKKSYPIRWLIVFGTLVLTLVSAVVVILIGQQIRMIKAK